MTEIASNPTPLVHDVMCIACGYNLRGLEPTGRCPECGLTVADSNRGDRLAFADPAWLNKLRFGTALKLWNILIIMLISLAGGLAVGFMGAPIILMALVSAVGSLLGLWATFCITAQEPRTALTEDPVTLRKIIPTCAVVAFIGGVAHQLAGWAITPGSNLRGANAIWLIVSLLSGIAGLIVFIGELKYFRRFALRVPDLKLARSTRILMWGLTFCWGFISIGGAVFALVVAPVMAAAAPAGPGATNSTTTGLGYTATVTTTPAGATPLPGAPPIPGAIMGIGLCLFGAFAGIFFIWYLVLLSRYRKMFQSAIAQNQTGTHQFMP